MKKLSVVISAHNEEAKIEHCLKSVQWADEIIFVDSESSDRTVNIAQKYTKYIYHRENNPMLNVNKNFGFSKASGDWILSLDADEAIEKKLVQEIQSILSNESSYDGFQIPRKNYIFGKWIRHTGWFPDYQLRLFKRGAGQFAEEHVHEQIIIKGKVNKLNNYIIHQNYETIAQYISKMQRYTDNQADYFVKQQNHWESEDIIRYPKEEFLRRYFAQEGYKDGFHGIALSILQSLDHVVLLLKIWEKQGFPEKVQDEKVYIKELHKANSDINYWVATINDQKNKNRIKQAIIKLLYKIIELL